MQAIAWIIDVLTLTKKSGVVTRRTLSLPEQGTYSMHALLF